MLLNSEVHQKITAGHLSRLAYLYVRQSTLRQVFENTESTQRQYALRERAVALGWPFDRVVVIDSDLGQSGSSAADREGFQRLVTEVSLGRVGIVLGLEVSRLARNSTDWHRLLELCALSDTLILDEDGLYDPAHFNDRLLLGLKGTMSEAELHVLKARLRGGILSRARRGELKQMVPVGFVHDAQERVILDPDVQVQAAVRLFFDTFRRTGSCLAVVKEFHAKDLLFPRRLRSGAHKGELVWAVAALSCATDHPQSALRRRLRVRSHQASSSAEWEVLLAAGSERAVDPAARYASGLHHLGRVPLEPAACEGKRAGLEYGAASGPCT